ncbi:MAG: rod shape-determining protein MreC [Campylobacteraceae bacterium]|nr:rod shape-determining protein MreC [Campylobacteraceae bacterium]
MNKIRSILFVLILLIISLVFGSYIRGQNTQFFGDVISFFKNGKDEFVYKFNSHFNQAKEIEMLRAENQELRKTAILLSTFAYELNQVLSDINSTKFAPDIELTRTLSYVNIGDYSKFWIEFKDFNNSKIYGAISQGHTAGIVVDKDSNPMLILQNDPLSSFSVYIGYDEIPAILTGDGMNVIAKFIPKWLNPQVGDEVFTNGLDNVFFAGIPVGVVKEIAEEDLYKSAIIEPYFKENTPTYLYIVTKER